MRGTMLWFSEAKDHGFISTEDGERLYVHGDAFDDAPPQGRCAGLTVEFLVEDGWAGRRARGVRLVPDVDRRRARRRRM